MTVWVSSDYHLNHANIIKYCDRPFQSVNKMNKAIIRNHNRVVKNNDTWIFLGDFALTSSKNIEHYLKKLNGYKIIVCGNHDKSPKRMIELGFDEAYKSMYIYEGKILTHVPVYIDGRLNMNVSVDNWQYYPIPIPQVKYINLCGHSHNNWVFRFKDNNSKKYNFSWNGDKTW
jgi:calcineurin-like phosphoesterase family protein